MEYSTSLVFRSINELEFFKILEDLELFHKKGSEQAVHRKIVRDLFQYLIKISIDNRITDKIADYTKKLEMLDFIGFFYHKLGESALNIIRTKEKCESKIYNFSVKNQRLLKFLIREISFWLIVIRSNPYLSFLQSLYTDDMISLTLDYSNFMLIRGVKILLKFCGSDESIICVRPFLTQLICGILQIQIKKDFIDIRSIPLLSEMESLDMCFENLFDSLFLFFHTVDVVKSLMYLQKKSKARANSQSQHYDIEIYSFINLCESTILNVLKSSTGQDLLKSSIFSNSNDKSLNFLPQILPSLMNSLNLQSNNNAVQMKDLELIVKLLLNADTLTLEGLKIPSDDKIKAIQSLIMKQNGKIRYDLMRYIFPQYTIFDIKLTFDDIRSSLILMEKIFYGHNVDINIHRYLLFVLHPLFVIYRNRNQFKNYQDGCLDNLQNVLSNLILSPIMIDNWIYVLLSMFYHVEMFEICAKYIEWFQHSIKTPLKIKCLYLQFHNLDNKLYLKKSVIPCCLVVSDNPLYDAFTIIPSRVMSSHNISINQFVKWVIDYILSIHDYYQIKTLECMLFLLISALKIRNKDYHKLDKDIGDALSHIENFTHGLSLESIDCSLNLFHHFLVLLLIHALNFSTPSHLVKVIIKDLHSYLESFSISLSIQIALN